MEHHQCNPPPYHLGSQEVQHQLLHRQVHRPEPQEKNQDRRRQWQRCPNQLNRRVLELVIRALKASMMLCVLVMLN